MILQIPQIKEMLQAMVSTSLTHAKDNPGEDILPNAMALTDSIVRMFSEDRQAFKLQAPGDTSDGYHTFDELYQFRMLYNAAWFNTLAEWQEAEGDQGYKLFKSWKHSDGELAFGGGWFVVGAELPKIGQITNHYEKQHWDLFLVPEKARAPVWDGHTAAMVAERLEEFLGGRHDETR